MADILEIPVICDESADAIEFIKVLTDKKERSYSGFRLFEYEVEKNKSIYFYLLEDADNNGNLEIWDRIIPKSPLSLFFFRTDVKIIDTPLAGTYDFYTKRYETPAVFLSRRSDNQDVKFQDDILQTAGERVFFYDPDSVESQKEVLVKTLQSVLDFEIEGEE
ncbi:MAG: hypothetical protein AB7T22_16315 [Calditrichaceae bacterium]